MKIKKTLLIVLGYIILTSAAMASTSIEIANQYENRNWNYHTALYARQAHLVDYFDNAILARSKELIQKFVKELEGITGETAALFYPETNIFTDSDRIVFKDKFVKTVSAYETMLGWVSFLEAIETERWGDVDEGSCHADSNNDGSPDVNPLSNPDCGRRSRGNYAVSNLTNFQRLSLSDFKQVVLDELDLIKETNGKIPVGPGPARVFQFLFDSRAIDKLIQESYVKASDLGNPDLRKQNLIDIGRALIVQVFQTENGKIINSDLVEVLLEDNRCFLEEKKQEIDCQLSYVKSLIWDRNMSADQLVTNLILDPKGIKPVFDSLISKFSEENPESVSRQQMLELLQRAYFSLCLAYEIEPEELSVSPTFLNHIIKQIKLSADYLINKRNIIGLQIARGLQELILFLEVENAEK